MLLSSTFNHCIFDVSIYDQLGTSFGVSSEVEDSCTWLLGPTHHLSNSFPPLI